MYARLLQPAEHVRPDDLRGLSRFREDYPEARAYLLYLGRRQWQEKDIAIVPFEAAARALVGAETML